MQLSFSYYYIILKAKRKTLVFFNFAYTLCMFQAESSTLYVLKFSIQCVLFRMNGNDILKSSDCQIISFTPKKNSLYEYEKFKGFFPVENK